MHKKSLNLLSSANHLAEGKILIHPTEGIWGIGCDALNKESFLRIYDLKKRPKNKSFILLYSRSKDKYANQLIENVEHDENINDQMNLSYLNVYNTFRKLIVCQWIDTEVD